MSDEKKSFDQIKEELMKSIRDLLSKVGDIRDVTGEKCFYPVCDYDKAVFDLLAVVNGFFNLHYRRISDYYEWTKFPDNPYGMVKSLESFYEAVQGFRNKLDDRWWEDPFKKWDGYEQDI